MDEKELREELLDNYTASLLFSTRLALYGDITYYVENMNTLILTSFSMSMYDEQTKTITVPSVFDELNTYYMKLDGLEDVLEDVNTVDLCNISNVICLKANQVGESESTYSDSLRLLYNWTKLVGTKVEYIWDSSFLSATSITDLELPLVKYLGTYSFGQACLKELPSTLVEVGSFICGEITGDRVYLKDIERLTSSFTKHWDGEWLRFTDMHINTSVFDYITVKNLIAENTYYFGGLLNKPMHFNYLNLGMLSLYSGSAFFCFVDEDALTEIEKLPHMQKLLKSSAGMMGQQIGEITPYYSIAQHNFVWLLNHNLTFDELHFNLPDYQKNTCFEEYILTYLRLSLNGSNSKVYYAGRLVIG